MKDELKQAIEMIQTHCYDPTWIYQHYDEQHADEANRFNQAVEIIETALNRLDELEAKATGKKVVENFMLYCPTCGKQLTTGQDDYNYCLHCGQKLDWGK